MSLLTAPAAARSAPCQIAFTSINEHRMVLTRLQPGTCYDLTVRATDPAGRVAALPGPVELCTTGRKTGALARLGLLLAGMAVAAALGALGLSRRARRRIGRAVAHIRNMWGTGAAI